MTKSERTMRDQHEFVERVERMLAEAERAAIEASTAWAMRGIKDDPGSSVLYISNPSYRFRQALKFLNITDRWPCGWVIKITLTVVKEQSGSIAHEGALAGRRVLSAAFPDDGHFGVHYYSY